MAIPDVTQAEIAWVTRRYQDAEDTAGAHQQDSHGFCSYCCGRPWPCNPWLVADHARTWAQGRLDEIHRRLNAGALTGQTMHLPTVERRSPS